MRRWTPSIAAWKKLAIPARSSIYWSHKLPSPPCSPAPRCIRSLPQRFASLSTSRGARSFSASRFIPPTGRPSRLSCSSPCSLFPVSEFFPPAICFSSSGAIPQSGCSSESPASPAACSFPFPFFPIGSNSLRASTPSPTRSTRCAPLCSGQFIFAKFSTPSRSCSSSRRPFFLSACLSSPLRSVAPNPRALSPIAKKKRPAQFHAGPFQITVRRALRLLLSLVDLCRHAAHEDFQLVQSRFRFFPPRPIRVEINRVLERFHRSRLRIHFDRTRRLLVNRRIGHHARRQQIPCLRVLGIKFRRLL